MSRGCLTFGVLALAMAMAAGCSTSARRARPAYAGGEHLIFNPDATGVPPSQVARSDWPATTTYTPRTEQIEYRETVIDQQGRFGHDSRGDYRRYFRSTRTGRAIR